MESTRCQCCLQQMGGLTLEHRQRGAPKQSKPGETRLAPKTLRQPSPLQGISNTKISRYTLPLPLQAVLNATYPWRMLFGQELRSLLRTCEPPTQCRNQCSNNKVMFQSAFQEMGSKKWTASTVVRFFRNKAPTTRSTKNSWLPP